MDIPFMPPCLCQKPFTGIAYGRMRVRVTWLENSLRIRREYVF